MTQKRVRPFEKSAQVIFRGYSLPLQRVMTDFGADESFSAAAKKIKEPYGIEVSIMAAQRIAEEHAKIIHLEEDSRHQEQLSSNQNQGAAVIISEIDGSMLPIVDIQIPADKTNEKRDRRKHRKLVYKEARLALSHEKDSVTPVYTATMGDVKEAGKQLRFSAEAVGFNAKTKVHGVGDGAAWIANQFEEQFAANSSYLIDFYHLCEYLAAAAKSISPQNSKWLEHHKSLLKQSKAEQVLLALEPYIESPSTTDENAPVRRACYRYLKNRDGQFKYKEALENGLPIGSGEVESEHRYISQKRLKLAGAWWKEDNAAHMLSLRVLRANNYCQGYWEKARLKSAA